MQFPKITHCLVCQDFRLERGGLSSLLGFYGITPEINILVREFDLPIDRLVFVLFGVSSGGGDCQVKIRIEDSNGKEIRPMKEKPLSLPARPDKTLLGFGFTNLKFPCAGRYGFVLFVDGAENYRTDFQVSQGSKEDFER